MRTGKLTLNVSDAIFRTLAYLFAAAILLLVIQMIYEMTEAALPSIKKFGLRFLYRSIWDPVRGEFGALPFIYGTLVSSFLALLIAVPLSLGAAIYLAELAPIKLRAPVAFVIELLAAIPSVVYGLWGIFVLAPWLRSRVEPWLAEHLGFLPLFRGPYYGIGMLAGGLILAIMIVPLISAVTRELLMAVPAELREAALALGATRWEMIRMASLSYARSGIIGAIILGLGRALGETMAVTMVIGNRPLISASLFAPAYTMASVIANEFTEATYDLYIAALIEIGLILFVLTVAVNLVARLLVWRIARGAPRVGRE